MIQNHFSTTSWYHSYQSLTISLKQTRRKFNSFRTIWIIIWIAMIVIPRVCCWCNLPSPSSAVLGRRRCAASTYNKNDYSYHNPTLVTRPFSHHQILYQQRRRRPRRRRQEEEEDEFYYDDYYGETHSKERQDEDMDDDDNYYYFDEEEDDDQSRKQKGRRGGMYKVYFDDGVDVDPKETQLDWELCRTVDERTDTKLESLVLLPPAVVECPTAVVHFVGGTFFGSAPKVWYRALLEGLVRNTQCAIVITPIPVTLFKSPLDHIHLCRQIQQSFDYAMETILEDDYGEAAMQDIPICGIGHSLGSRLLVVLETLQASSKNRGRTKSVEDSHERGDSNNEITSARTSMYKSFVLISFTNYGASAGVPGVSALLRQSRKQERLEEINQQMGGKKSRNNRRPRRGDGRRSQRRDGRRRRQEELTQERRRRRRRQQKQRDWWFDEDDDDDEYDIGRRDRYDSYYNDDYDDDEDDIEWEELVGDLRDMFQEQADKVKSALTPKSKELEFYPTPEQLWKAVNQDARYTVPETLLIQFDDDPFDQSSKFAQFLVDTNSSDVKFARLRGNHLSPVSLSVAATTTADTSSNQDGDGWFFDGLPSKASQTIWNVLQKGRGGKTNTKGQEATLGDLRQSIARYITDVVTK